MSEPATVAGSVVVGVDGSDASKAALRWAVEQARLTGSSVDAVIAWHEIGMYAWPVPASDLDFEGTARAVLDQSLADVLGDEPPVPVRGHVVQGHPARVLIDAACDARCWWSATGATPGSPRHCWARSASTVCTTPAARWWGADPAALASGHGPRPAAAVL